MVEIPILSLDLKLFELAAEISRRLDQRALQRLGRTHVQLHCPQAIVIEELHIPARIDRIRKLSIDATAIVLRDRIEV